MPSKSAIKQSVAFAIVCAILLAIIAYFLPRDVLSVPVYAVNGTASIGLCVWIMLRRAKKAENKKLEEEKVSEPSHHGASRG